MIGSYKQKIGLGTWAFGGRAYGPLDDRHAIQIAKRAYELGIRFFDTAHIYANGKSEELLGEALENCNDVKFCTKLGYDVVSNKATKRYDSDFLEQSLDISLKRLRRSQIDLLLLHNPPTEILEQGHVFDWLDRMKKSGKISQWGTSIYDSVRDAELALNAGAQAIEARYSILRRDVVDELEPKKWSFNFIARSPFDGGLLSGKYQNGENFPKTDQRSALTQDTFQAYESLNKDLHALIQQGFANSLAELAIRFTAYAPKVSIVIPGAKSVEQLERNIKAVSLGPLPSHAIEIINNLRAKHLSKVIK